MALLFLPSRMIKPLPKLRSIWESAASSAFDLSMENPSTIRSAIAIAFAPYDRDREDRQTAPPSIGRTVHDLFLVRKMFFSPWGVLAPFRGPWSLLIFWVVPFGYNGQR